MNPVGTLLGGISRLFQRDLHGSPGNDIVMFDEATFMARERFRANYQDLSAALVGLCDFDTILDVGCANGFLLECMLAYGKQIQGIELSSASLAFIDPAVRRFVTIGDATATGKLGSYDLVSCIEVAEHIRPVESEALIESLTNNSRKWIYFTAAPPYQPGYGHINCQPQFFWMSKFRYRGFDVDWDKTAALIEKIANMQPANWLPMNSLVFRRRT